MRAAWIWTADSSAWKTTPRRPRANNRSLLKVGTGTLRYSGTTANTITGTTAVLAGTLELNKTAGGADGGLAVAGPLVVGDNVSGSTDTLRLARQRADGHQPGDHRAAAPARSICTASPTTPPPLATLTSGRPPAASGDQHGAGNWIHRGDVTVILRPGITTAVPAPSAGTFN